MRSGHRTGGTVQKTKDRGKRTKKSQPVFVDLNNDGRADLVVGREGGVPGLFVNRGPEATPSFEERRDSPFESLELLDVCIRHLRDKDATA